MKADIEVNIETDNQRLVCSRSCVSSKELSNGWAMSGKYGPKENSVITCERFITVELVSSLFSPSTEVGLTAVVDMLVASIAMPKSCDVQVRWWRTG